MPDTITVSFSAAPGTVSEASRQVTSGSAIGDLPVPSCPEWSVFGGWWAGATPYSEGDAVIEASYTLSSRFQNATRVTAETVVSADTTLVARYVFGFVNVYFNAAPGTIVEAQQWSIEIPVGGISVSDTGIGTMPEVTPPDGYIFAGWYDGSTLIDEETVFTEAGNLNLLAHYEEAPAPPASPTKALYRLLVDGDDCLDYSDQTLVLLSPQAELELDTAGSLEFTIPPAHRFYDRFTMDSIMSMTLEIWEDTTQHWFGRPVELTVDFYKNKKIYCEGAMSYFNDTVQRPHEYDTGSMLSEVFEDFIDNHNAMADDSRKFTIAKGPGYDRTTISDHEVYRKIDYEQSSDVLKSKLLDAEDGHLFFERTNGVNYISWLKDDVWPYSCNQDVQFGVNLLNLAYSFDGKDFATCVLPLGANQEESGEPLTIASVNGGSDILVGNAAANYGKIVKVESFSDISDATELMNEGRKLLSRLQYNATMIECSAVDLHSKDNTRTPFRVGQLVSCISGPHGIVLDLPLSKMTLRLDSAAKQITLGKIPKKTLSRFYKTGSQMPTTPTGTTTEVTAPEDFIITPPTTEGETLTATLVPKSWRITALPLQTEYASGATIDYSGLRGVTLSSTDPEVVFTNSKYPNGVIYDNDPEMEYPMTVMPTNPESSQVVAWARWTNPYTGKAIKRPFYLTNTTVLAEEQAAIAAHGSAYPSRIGIVATGLNPDYVFEDGSYINTAGFIVKAYYPDGAVYDRFGYQYGRIPSTELVFSSKKASMLEGKYVAAASSDLDTSPVTQPIRGGSGGSAIFTFPNGTIHTLQFEIWGGNGQILVFVDTTGHSAYAMGVSDTYGGATLHYTWLESGNGASRVVEEKYLQTHNSWRPSADQPYVYYCSDGHSCGGDNYAGSGGDINFTPWGQVKAGPTAWTMVHGNRIERYEQTITISWKTPAGNTLETSFKILVKSKNYPGKV